MKLETKRLKLRKFLLSDVESAYNYLSDKKTMLYIEEPYNFEQTQEFVKECCIDDEPYVYALIEKLSDKLIGHMIFHEYEYSEIFEIGFIIKSDYWGNGYSYEMAKALIKYGFSELDLHKIVAHTIRPNTASIHILKRLGFAEEGRLRLQNFDNGEWVDEYCFGLLKDEYLNNTW